MATVVARSLEIANASDLCVPGMGEPPTPDLDVLTVAGDYIEGFEQQLPDVGRIDLIGWTGLTVGTVAGFVAAGRTGSGGGCWAVQNIGASTTATASARIPLGLSEADWSTRYYFQIESWTKHVVQVLEINLLQSTYVGTGFQQDGSLILRGNLTTNTVRFRLDAGATSTNGTANLVVGTWYRVEQTWIGASRTNTVIVYEADTDTIFESLSAVGTASGVAYNQFQLEADSGGATDKATWKVNIDDMHIRHGANLDNMHKGAVGMYGVTSTETDEWSKTGAATAHACVDDITTLPLSGTGFDDSTTFISSLTNGAQTLMGIMNTPLYGTIDPTWRAQSISVPLRTTSTHDNAFMSTIVKDSTGTIWTGPSARTAALAAQTTIHSKAGDELRSGLFMAIFGEPLLSTQIANFEVGVKVQTGSDGNLRAVSTMWVNVEYAPHL